MVVGLVVAAAGLVALGFVLAEALVTPEQAALRVEPRRVPITDPVRREVLEDVVQVRAEVVETGLVSVPVPDGVPPVVTGVPVKVGDEVEAGSVLVELAGRPLIALYGILPAWRDFTDGMDDGPDVAQLQRALADLGLYTGETDGRFGRGTRDAVAALYQRLGYSTPGGRRPFLPKTEVMFLPEGLRVFRLDLTPGATMQPGSLVLHDGSRTLRVAPPVEPEVIRQGLTLRLRLPDGDAITRQIDSVVRGAGDDELLEVRLVGGLPPGVSGSLPADVVVSSTDGAALSASPAAVFEGPDGPYVVVLVDDTELRVPVEVGVVTADRVEVRSADPRLTEGTPLVLNPGP